jgi:type IX secretion system PorP/SprF family membrane protein
LGLLFNTDRAGDSQYGITQAALSVAWLQALGADSVHWVSAGLQAGMVQHRINTGELTFDSQYNGDVYDPGLPSNEVFAQEQVVNPDFAFGISYLLRSSDRFSLGGGISLHHPLEPDVYFISATDDGKTDRKLSADLRSDIGLSENLHLQPALLFSTQKKFNELNFGGHFKLLLSRKPGKTVNLYAGAFLRSGDAVIPAVGVDFNEWHFGLSYDVNTSDLKRASDGRGGYEVSLTYLIKKVRPFGIRPPCPVY